MAGASPVLTAGAVAGTQDGVAAAAATVADEAQHVQRIIAVHLAREAEVHARTDIRQVWLLQLLAVHPRQAQALCSSCAPQGHGRALASLQIQGTMCVADGAADFF